MTKPKTDAEDAAWREGHSQGVADQVANTVAAVRRAEAAEAECARLRAGITDACEAWRDNGETYGLAHLAVAIGMITQEESERWR